MTSNPASTVEADTFTVRRSIRIAASVDAVWSAVTEPAHMSRWFGRTELTDGAGTMTFDGYGAVPLRVIATDAPHSVTYRWNNDDALGALPVEYDESRATEFTFTLAAVDGGTELTVVESGFDRTSDPASNMRDHATGWRDELDKMVALLEAAA